MTLNVLKKKCLYYWDYKMKLIRIRKMQLFGYNKNFLSAGIKELLKRYMN